MGRTIIFAMAACFSLMAGIAAAEHGPGGKPQPDSDLARYAPSSPVAGAVRVVGSETMQPLLNRLAADFRRRHVDARVSVEGGGSASAVKEFLEKRRDSKSIDLGRVEAPNEPLIVASSRALSESEIKHFSAKHGYKPTAVPIAVDAVAIYVNRDNPLREITLAQLDAMFSSTRYRGADEITRWGAFGLGGEWEQAEIHLYGRDEKSGTRAFVKEHVLQHGEFSPLIHAEVGAASVILAVSRDRYGIGYSGIGLQASTVRALALSPAAGRPAVEPTAETVADGSYPLRRLLYLYVDRPATGSGDAVVNAFVAFATSREGQEAVIRAGFYPVTSKQIGQGMPAVAANEAR